MIQRKQTLFLLAVAVIGIANLFIPFLGFTRDLEPFSINLVKGISSIGISSDIYYPFTLTALTILLSVVCIFLYRNRVIQYKIANSLILLDMFTAGLFFLLNYVNVPNTDLHYSFGAFLPILGAIFAFLAAHFIKKDELLVRSADRIR